MEPSSSEKRFALLIDADNVSSKYLKPILDELSKYGTVTYKRIYGDWTLNLHAKWKEELLKNSITPIQQFGYTQGKNATDSAMIIDAMDILYANSVDGFCIVSSDSDFTRLAVRLRESGRMVIGMGEQKTPIPFRTACDVFTTLELLAPDTRRNRRGRKGKQEDPTPIPEATATRQEIEQAVVDIVSDNINNDKNTGLGEIGSRLLKMYPDFDVRSYGTSQISKLLSGFSSVVLTKIGYNLTVQLAEGVEPGSILSFDADDDAPEVEADATAEHSPAESSDGEVETGGRRRRRRGGRGRRKADTVEAMESVESSEDVEATVAATTPENTENASDEVQNTQDAESSTETAIEAASEPTPKKRTRRSRKKAAEAESIPVENAAPETEAAPVEVEVPVQAVIEPETPVAEDKPKRTRTRRSRKKVTEASSQDKNESPDAPAEIPQKTSPAKTAAAADSATVTPEPDVTSSEAETTTPNVAAAAEGFILQQIEKAGAEGIPAAVLGKRVRTRVKNFRLKDLGFKNFREYLATIPGVTVSNGDTGYLVTTK